MTGPIHSARHKTSYCLTEKLGLSPKSFLLPLDRGIFLVAHPSVNFDNISVLNDLRDGLGVSLCG